MGTVTVISPLELVRTKLQAQHVSYRELATCVQASVAQGGWRSLWLGWGPTALRDVPFSGRHLGLGHRVKEPLDNVQGLSSQVLPLLLMVTSPSLGVLICDMDLAERGFAEVQGRKPAPGVVWLWVGGEKSGAHSSVPTFNECVCFPSSVLVQLRASEELAKQAKTKGPDISGHQLCGWWHLRNGELTGLGVRPPGVLGGHHQDPE